MWFLKNFVKKNALKGLLCFSLCYSKALNTSFSFASSYPDSAVYRSPKNDSYKIEDEYSLIDMKKIIEDDGFITLNNLESFNRDKGNYEDEKLEPKIYTASMIEASLEKKEKEITKRQKQKNGFTPGWPPGGKEWRMTKGKGKPTVARNGVGKGPTQEQPSNSGWSKGSKKGKGTKGKGKGKGKRSWGKGQMHMVKGKGKRQERTEVWRESKRRERKKERKRGAIVGRMQMLFRCTDEVEFWWLMNFEQLISKVRVFQNGDKNSAPPVRF
jgi:hypothetical protein